jgi:glycoprotein endo-alpha-1,2-mannosidase
MDMQGLLVEVLSIIYGMRSGSDHCAVANRWAGARTLHRGRKETRARVGFSTMMRWLAIVLGCLGLAGAGLAAVPEVDRTGGEAAIFYYPWWGNPEQDGGWEHWNQNGHQPSASLAARFYPVRGPYSSSATNVVRAHMQEIAEIQVDTVIVSWWGPGSREDARLPLVLREASAAGLRVGIHLEPWLGRTPESVAAAIVDLHARGIDDVYVYDSLADADADWAAALAPLDGVRVFAHTSLPGRAKAGGFDGLYTYDVYVYDGTSFGRVCASARRLALICAPSVGPGFDARAATGDPRVRLRKRGTRYDSMWKRALRARAEIVTITSYNEWHEGTQIEAARAVGAPYGSYDGAYGLRGAEAEKAYLSRTAPWVRQLHAR